MAQRLSLDLNDNPDLKKLVVDLQPGDKVEASLVFVIANDQTAKFDLDEVMAEDSPADEKEDEEDDEEDDDEPAGNKPDASGSPGPFGS